MGNTLYKGALIMLCYDLAPDSSWTPSWVIPLLVLLPVASVLIGFMLLMWSVSHQKNIRLLNALIPADIYQDSLSDWDAPTVGTLLLLLLLLLPVELHYL